MSSRGQRSGLSNTKALGLVAAALVTAALLLAMPLASLASARVEARAGGAVAIAGGDDCNVGTQNSSTQGNPIPSTQNNGDQTTQDQYANDATNPSTQDLTVGNNPVDQTTQDVTTGNTNPSTQDQTVGNLDQTTQDVTTGNGVQQAQYGSGNTVVDQSAGAVAIASDNCNVQTNGTGTTGNNNDTTNGTGDTTTQNDNGLQDLSGQQDGNTIDTSNLDTLPPGGQGFSDGLSTGETSTPQAGGFSQERTAPGSSGSIPSLRANSSRSGQERTVSGQGRRGSSVRTSNANGPLPSKDELRQIGKARRFDSEPDASMSLSIRSLGLYDAPVRNSDTKKAFDQGVIHVPDTAFPWDKSNQKNVFLAGPRLGPPGSDGRLIFYRLGELKRGDEVSLKDRKGQEYKYRVSKLFKVKPNDAWAADTLVGRDTLTLESYTLPSSGERIIVRADRVGSDASRTKKHGKTGPSTQQTSP